MDILEKYKNILITELNKSYSKEDLSNISFEFPRDTSPVSYTHLTLPTKA